MEFYDSLNVNSSISCSCDDYCTDSPMGDTGCDDDNEGWHTGD